VARIPEDVIERLKAEVSIERLAEAQGITLKRHGADLIGLCPFHDDRAPSLVITPKKNLWHCLGACQQGGSVIDWVMKSEGVSFRHAVELLQNDYLPATKAPGRVKHSSVPKLAPVTTELDDQRLLNQVTDFYHATLKQSPDAFAYLEKRGLKSPEAIDAFKLGYANRTLGYRLPYAARRDGAALRGQLQQIGIYRESGHEHFNGSLVIPVLDEHGNVVEVYGRKLRDDLRPGTPKHLYLPGPHRGVWNRPALAASKEIILCEALIDALTLWCAGYRNVTASYGIEGFTDGHLAAFKQHGTERVLIAYDRDAAGDAAAEKLAKQLTAAGLDCYRLQFPKGMDANAYACQVQPATKSLGVVIRSAVWMGRGKARPVTTAVAEAMIADTIEPASSSSLAAELLSEPVAEPESQAMPEPVLPASPVPPAPALESNAEQREHEIVIHLEDRRYRLRGLTKNLSFDVLKVNVLVARDSAVHVDTLDLYQARSRASFIKQTAIELGVSEDLIKSDLGRVLLQCEALQEQHIHAAQQPKAVVTLSDEDQRAALELLRAPDLLTRIQQDFSRCGLVGEEVNTLVGYLAAVSRKLAQPLAVILQSTSAAGKSSLMDAVLRFLPAEERVQYSAMTGQSLFYLGETDLQHKVLAIVEEQGAVQASYALKLLQSEGELTIASTGKDPDTGKLVTQQYRVEGPVMIFLTTTAIEVDEELLNRCLVLTVNEDRTQTEAIHAQQRQRRTLAGLVQTTERESILTLHQNAQRLLKPLAVVNPYAERLTFLSTQTRTRRDHEKYLTLIDAIALLHQHQRPVKTVTHQGKPVSYVEVTLDDIAVANELAHEVLGRTLDELPPQTRKLLGLIESMVMAECRRRSLKRADYRFSRRDIRQHTGWSDGQLKIHCQRLQDLEYLLVHAGGRGRSLQYELLYDGGDAAGTRHLMGLIDVTTLRQQYDAKRSGQKGQRTGSSQGQVGPKSGGCQGSENPGNGRPANPLAAVAAESTETARLRDPGQIASYPQTAALAAAK